MKTGERKLHQPVPSRYLGNPQIPSFSHLSLCTLQNALPSARTG